MRSNGFQQFKSNGQRVWHGAMWRSEIDPFAALGEPDVLRRLTRANPVLSLRVFCELSRMGRSTFYALKARGEAPISYHRSSRVFITAKDAIEWCAARGRHGAVLGIVDWLEDRLTSGRVQNAASKLQPH